MRNGCYGPPPDGPLLLLSEWRFGGIDHDEEQVEIEREREDKRQRNDLALRQKHAHARRGPGQFRPGEEREEENKKPINH